MRCEYLSILEYRDMNRRCEGSPLRNEELQRVHRILYDLNASVHPRSVLGGTTVATTLRPFVLCPFVPYFMCLMNHLMRTLCVCSI